MAMSQTRKLRHRKIRNWPGILATEELRFDAGSLAPLLPTASYNDHSSGTRQITTVNQHSGGYKLKRRGKLGL